MHIGIALLPTDADSAGLLDFGARIEPFINQSTGLNPETNPPRLVLLDSFLGAGDEQRDLIRLILDDYVSRGRLLSRQYTARLTHIDCHPDSLVFAYLSRLRWINELADATFSAVRTYIDQNQIPRCDNTAALNAHERSTQMIFGTRFIAEQFVPHIRLGISPDRRLDPAITDLADPGILGRTITFDRMVVYEADAAGHIIRTLGLHWF